MPDRFATTAKMIALLGVVPGNGGRSMLEQLAKHLPGPAWAKDLRGEYLWANAAFVAIVGRTPLGLRADDLWGPDVAARVNAQDGLVIQTGQVQESIDEIVDPDGTAWRRWLVRRFPIFDVGGHLVMIGGISIDVSSMLNLTTGPPLPGGEHGTE